MTNIILIGMPGAGKTTIGMEISDTLGVPWIDTDQLIQRKTGKKLADYIEIYGVKEFKKIEEEVLLELDADGSVISTGGSVIYSDPGMNHLKDLGKVVYLEVDYDTIEHRIAANPNRGIAVTGSLDLRKLYDERVIKYRQWADFTINTYGKNIEEICLEIIRITV